MADCFLFRKALLIKIQIIYQHKVIFLTCTQEYSEDHWAPLKLELQAVVSHEW